MRTALLWLAVASAMAVAACGGAASVATPPSSAAAAVAPPTSTPVPTVAPPTATAMPTSTPAPITPKPTMRPVPKPTATPCVIPQHGGGDGDADNFGAPSDGDGCDR